MTDNSRYERGLKKFEELTGQANPMKFSPLAETAPDLVRYIVEYAAGDILSRPGLDSKSRQIATVAALTVLGSAHLQLKVHINGVLNVGVTCEQIIEIMIQMSIYAGFPAALNGVQAAREVFSERDASAAKDKG